MNRSLWFCQSDSLCWLEGDQNRIAPLPSTFSKNQIGLEPHRSGSLSSCKVANFDSLCFLCEAHLGVRGARFVRYKTCGNETSVWSVSHSDVQFPRFVFLPRPALIKQ